MNLVLGNSTHSQEYWQKGILVQLESYFVFCFKPNEKEEAKLKFSKKIDNVKKI